MKRSRTQVTSKVRRNPGPAVEEVSFDFDARSDYLTGFHKRKLQRIKHAREEAIKKERIERLEERKRMREDRKKEIETHVASVAILTKEAHAKAFDESDEEESGSDDETADTDTQESATVSKKLAHEDEYIDEDRLTTVTVEEMDISKDGLDRANGPNGPNEPDSTEKEPHVRPGTMGSDGKPANGSSQPERAKSKAKVTKTKKKKFRYETKRERKVTRAKEHAGNGRKARARRE